MLINIIKISIMTTADKIRELIAEIINTHLL